MNDSKARRGAPAGNANAKKRVPWLDSHDLNSPEGAQAFLQEIVKLILTGQIGARQASPLNGTINLLLQSQVLPVLERRIKELEAREVSKH